MLLTRANALTVLRLLLVPAFGWAILEARPVLATAVFWLAVVSDFADGWVARRFDEATPLGGLVDHAVDAAFVATGAFALACVGALPLLLAPLIVLAFLQYALDSRVLAERGLRPSALGRWNGIAYYVIVAVPIMRETLGLAWPGPWLVTALGWALVATTLLSMAERLRWLLLARRAPGSPA
jgi:cardiolipin synthase